MAMLLWFPFISFTLSNWFVIVPMRTLAKYLCNNVVLLAAQMVSQADLRDDMSHLGKRVEMNSAIFGRVEFEDSPQVMSFSLFYLIEEFDNSRSRCRLCFACYVEKGTMVE
jgi:hypothetical protein